ncbi:hypothetical protein HPG69_011880 [Diceros bicornis minor]|uniref:E3 ubiquitin-protein ligase n=1 Tax=Diceros bicornis minor TaxID=77932 RepID=A0A7J7ERZ0_DICBM|nr:hypothetical protein HPG69_011880 [Diceros bicornis minor]
MSPSSLHASDVRTSPPSPAFPGVPAQHRLLNFDLDRGVFPVVIQAVVDEGDVVEVAGHAHVLLAAFEKHVDGSFSVKPLKQKQIVDRVSYLLQEIYGIENKNNQETKPSDEENSDNSNECVVCLSDLRDTLILPCRHLCLCNSCADTLRYQASNCPICRLPFRALLQIRAVRKKPGALSPVSFSPVLAQSMDHDEHSCPFKKSKSHPASLASKKPKRETSSDSVPPGYEPISLLEALNGLRAISPAIPSAPLYEEITYSGVSDGLSQASCPLAGIDRIMESSHQKGKPRSKSPDSTLPSPSSPIHEEDEEKLSQDSDAAPPPGGLGLALSSSPESFLTEEVDEMSLKQGEPLPEEWGSGLPAGGGGGSSTALLAVSPSGAGCPLGNHTQWSLHGSPEDSPQPLPPLPPHPALVTAAGAECRPSRMSCRMAAPSPVAAASPARLPTSTCQDGPPPWRHPAASAPPVLPGLHLVASVLTPGPPSSPHSESLARLTAWSPQLPRLLRGRPDSSVTLASPVRTPCVAAGSEGPCDPSLKSTVDCLL